MDNNHDRLVNELKSKKFTYHLREFLTVSARYLNASTDCLEKDDDARH